MTIPKEILILGLSFSYFAFVIYALWSRWELITCDKEVICLEPVFVREKNRRVVRVECPHDNWTCAWLNETPENVQNAYRVIKCWLSGSVYWNCENLTLNPNISSFLAVMGNWTSRTS